MMVRFVFQNQVQLELLKIKCFICFQDCWKWVLQCGLLLYYRH